MAIKYSLSRNYLISGSAAYKAVVHPTDVIHEEDIYNRMSEANSTLSKGDMIACMQLYNQTLEAFLKEGCFVNTRHGNYRPTIKGNFSSPTENWNKNLHSKDVSVSASSNMVSEIQDAHVEKVSGDVVAPQPVELFDSKSNTINSNLTPGNMARLSGSRLNFDQSNSLEGIFFIASDAAETKVTDILDHTQGTIRFLIPGSLTTGSYHLEIRAMYTERNELRTGFLSSALQVK